MYIIAFDGGRSEVTTQDAGTLDSLVNLLERNHINFTVSNRCGKLTQDHFGWGLFTYWKQDFN